MSPPLIVLSVLVLIAAAYGMFKLKQGLHAWLARKGHSHFLRERLTVYHIYGALIVFGIAFAATGWFFADAARWVMVGLGLLVAAVPSAIWISLWQARKQAARDWPLDRHNS